MRIRRARPEDAPRLHILAQRLNEGALPAWRDAAPLAQNLAEAEAGFFAPDENRVLLVAADAADVPQGFAQAMMDREFFSGAPLGHLLFLVTDATQERRGIGRQLVAAVEDWARARGATGMILYVFATDEGPRRVYHRLGFQEDMVTMVKPFAPGGAGN